MGRIQDKIECGGRRNRRLRFGKLVEHHWRNAVVASAYEGGKARHTLVTQLLYGQTTNGSLHEHYNL